MSAAWTPEFDHPNVIVLGAEEVYSGYCSVRRFSFQYRLFQGGFSHRVFRDVVLRPPAVAVLPYYPESDEVVLIEQFRPGAYLSQKSPWLLEIVAGLIDEGETLEEAARRESLEEIGMEMISLVPVCEYLVSPGISSERIHIFCGRVSKPETGGVFGKGEDGEDIKVHVFSSDKALSLLKSGEILSSPTVIALQWLALNRASLPFPL